ncbi:MAG: hypothetical protein GY943_15350 [Chloroflexi bacterium]|nr:hypothetical protein [Chloroflexota bacterium]
MIKMTYIQKEQQELKKEHELLMMIKLVSTSCPDGVDWDTLECCLKEKGVDLSDVRIRNVIWHLIDRGDILLTADQLMKVD